MKQLNEIINLMGQFEEISMMNLRMHAGDILTQVSLGKTFLIRKAGKPIAFLSYLPEVGKPNVEIIIKVDKKGKINYGL